MKNNENASNEKKFKVKITNFIAVWIVLITYAHKSLKIDKPCREG